MALPRKGAIALVRQAFGGFQEDDCSTMAAALSYYTVFSLPPLLLLILLLLGALLDPQDVRGALESQIEGLMGPAGGEQVRTILERAERPGANGIVATLVGIGALVLGATGVFGQLQAALNRAWKVKPDPSRTGGLKGYFMKRVFSFGMVLGIAFLLLVSLAVTAVLSAFGDSLGGFVPGGASAAMLYVFNTALSLVVVTLLFAAMFKVLPDARISWRDVWVGAAVTALLFMVGKTLIGLYLGRSNPGEVFGAAGSLALMLVWIYYSSMILLFGAEFTRAWAEQRGAGIEPESHAVRTETTRPQRGATPPGAGA